MAPVLVQRPQRSAYVQRLAESLMNQSARPAYGLAGAVTNIGTPIAAAWLGRRAERMGQEEQRAETSAMGRLLAEAEKARRSGDDPMAAMNRIVAESENAPGYVQAHQTLLKGYQEQLAKNLFTTPERETATDIAGYRRYMDTGERVFPMAEAPTKPAKAPTTRKVNRGNVVVTEEFDDSTGQWKTVGEAPRQAPVEVKMPKNVTEVDATVQQIERNRALHKETGDPKFARIADRLEMKLTFGGNPPAAYVKARGSLNDAREGIAETYRLIERGRANPLKPSDRAAVSQSVNKARLAYAEMLNRGANFTESEQQMIDAVLGGDPNDVVQRALRGDESYLSLLRNAGEALERRGQQMVRTFTSPGVGEFNYPWQGQPGAEAQTMEASAIPAPSPAQGPRDFSTMSLEDLSAIDPATMSEEELVRAAQRFEELARGQ